MSWSKTLLTAVLATLVTTQPSAGADDLDGLASTSRRAVLQAMDRLSKSGPSNLTAPIFTRLAQLMQSPDNEVRDRAAVCLLSLQPHNNSAVQTLLRDLRNRDDNARKLAAEIIGRAGANGASLNSELVSVLSGDADPRVRVAAAGSLGLLGPEGKTAIPALIQALKRNQPLARRGPDMVAYDDQVHQACIVALGKVGAGSPEACHALTDIVADKHNASLHAGALTALAQMGPGAAPALNALLALLNTVPDDTTKEQIVNVLQQTGHDAATAVPALRKLMDSPNSSLRKSALEAVLAIDGNKESLQSILEVASNDKDPQMRRIATALISRTDVVAGSPSMGTVLHDLEHATEPEARLASIKSIGNLGTKAAEALPLLVKISLVAASPPKERAMAYEAIKKIDPTGDKTIALLRPNLDDCFKARASSLLLDYIGSPKATQLSSSMKSKWHL